MNNKSRVQKLIANIQVNWGGNLTFDDFQQLANLAILIENEFECLKHEKDALKVERDNLLKDKLQDNNVTLLSCQYCS